MQNENMPQDGAPTGGDDQNMGGGAAPADAGAAPTPQGGGDQNMGGPADAAPMPEKKKPWWKFW